MAEPSDALQLPELRSNDSFCSGVESPMSGGAFNKSYQAASAMMGVETPSLCKQMAAKQDFGDFQLKPHAVQDSFMNKTSVIEKPTLQGKALPSMHLAPKARERTLRQQIEDEDFPVTSMTLGTSVKQNIVEKDYEGEAPKKSIGQSLLKKITDQIGDAEEILTDLPPLAYNPAWRRRQVGDRMLKT